ncbi:carbohydrate esterase family 4 protein [Thermothelomyces thermophilus ATCC 42464]|uniref:Carbohydrate esterase family 4 protein n=1 Tax=Thermothelomyces thermophilus (strain ATCC 42464 / BCRC 31852 / DSM 1799) TaxID=573729 RepID=G2QKR1_THET4|nr:carbohydrate esterase family 4 protein [Thermothelomyces thermophilus ATCC 42464]AEO60543.1 carbohydrate esterase family 4 protein [Thermothelomyces thermophilus ATCC 42464]
MLLNRRHLVAGVAGLLAATGVHAACSSDLVIDDFTTWLTGLNNLGSENGDDGTMTAIAASPGQVVFVPKDDGSYFYESFPCQQANTEGYNAIQFSVLGPEGGSFAFELQTTSSCDDEVGVYNSSWTEVGDLTGERHTITLPLEGWDDSPNYDGIVGLTWSTFSENGIQWSVGNVSLVCGGGGDEGDGGGSASQSSTVATKPTATTATSSQGSTTSSPAVSSPPATCSNLLIDDWASQSRLTFLGYNAMEQTSSDDESMSSVVVSDNRVTLTPRDDDSYFYSQFGCLDASEQYGGISFSVQAKRGTSFSVTLAYVTKCGSQNEQSVTQSTDELGWTFDGTEKLYSVPFSAFADVDTTRLTMIYFGDFSGPVTFGPMSFYCGSTPSEYELPSGIPTAPPITVTTTAAPAPTKAMVIDTFGDPETNDLGHVALQQHNAVCDPDVKPYPETWDSLEAARYATASDMYIPINHFAVDLTRVIGFALKGFYGTEPTRLTKMEIVDELPEDWPGVPPKLASGRLVFSCTRPDSFAFAIDDGDPALAPRVMEIVQQADIPVTFFTVGLPLLDRTNGLADMYKTMAARGHQIALHSYTHPPLEGLPSDAAIDWEYANDIGAVRQVFGDGSPNNNNNNNPVHTNYFRPPFGTEGARMRQRLAANLEDANPYLVQWSVDVEDWLWAESDTPEKQLDAFKRDVAAGGNLVVMHYLYNSTVELLPEFIEVAKATGKRLMRVDQCMEDPNAPPLEDEEEG